MTDKDKGGVDAGQVEPTVVVHDYDPVRPAPPRKPKAKPAQAEPDVEVDE